MVKKGRGPVFLVSFETKVYNKWRNEEICVKFVMYFYIDHCTILYYEYSKLNIVIKIRLMYG